jgi:valyl-tRNA synthetase
VHNSTWPAADPTLEDEPAEAFGEILLGIAVAARRYKSERKLPLSTELPSLLISIDQPGLALRLKEATSDLSSITRARDISIVGELHAGQTVILASDSMRVAIAN